MNFIQGSVLKAHDVHEQSATEQTATASDGKNLSFLASAQEVEVCRNVVEEYTSGRLVGVVVLKVDKIPVEGTTTGEIQVTIGMSDKTRAASDAAHRKISESMKAREGGSQPDSAIYPAACFPALPGCQ